MIDLNKAINEFETYVKGFNIKEKNISYKYKHSYKVMEYSMSIAKSLNLSEEEVNLSGLIGLLHDIGRFEQWTKYKTFRDNKSIDHGDLSVSVLFDNDYIRKFIHDEQYDEIIKKSILYHNKYEIGKLDEKGLLFSKIVRDADKLDILDILSNSYKTLKLNSDTISPKVLETAYDKKLINLNDVKNDLDGKICGIAEIFDIYFKYSFEVIKERKYVDVLIDLVLKHIKEKDTIDKLVNLKDILNEFIEVNIK